MTRRMYVLDGLITNASALAEAIASYEETTEVLSVSEVFESEAGAEDYEVEPFECDFDNYLYLGEGLYLVGSAELRRKLRKRG